MFVCKLNFEDSNWMLHVYNSPPVQSLRPLANDLGETTCLCLVMCSRSVCT